MYLGEGIILYFTYKGFYLLHNLISVLLWLTHVHRIKEPQNILS